MLVELNSRCAGVLEIFYGTEGRPVYDIESNGNWNNSVCTAGLWFCFDPNDHNNSPLRNVWLIKSSSHPFFYYDENSKRKDRLVVLCSGKLMLLCKKLRGKINDSL